jgi:glycosyltransferase involved in cell wall biosynthesis
VPEVTVIMPVNNGELFVDKAIKSILSQTYKDFTLLILNDGSTDSTPQKLAAWSQRDSRVLTIDSPKKGIASSLNHLISISDSPFIARMDVDDIAMPERLALQVAALKTDKNCGLIGCKVKLFGNSSETWHFRQNSAQTKALSLLGNTSLCHPTWMFRREITSKIRYSTEFPHMEDMRFIAEYIAKPNSKLYALEDVLLKYRVHIASISNTKSAEQLKQRARILGWTWIQHGIEFDTMDPMQLLKVIHAPKIKMTTGDRLAVKTILSRVIPQLVKVNPSVKEELLKRLKTIDPSNSLETSL